MKLLFLLAVSSLLLAELKPDTIQAFDVYIRATEQRLDREIRSNGPFLALDASPERLRQAREGQVVTQPFGGKEIVRVPSGYIHDWIGDVFIPGGTLEKTIALVQDYNNHKNFYKPEVIDSRLLSREGNHFRIYYRLLKKKVITVVLNTEHDVQYYPLDSARIYSRSHSAKIAEVEDPGKPGEREMRPNEGHGFLWRLNSYWRFLERDGGVWVECEAISLTRTVPTGLGWMIEPIIKTLPRESLANTLRATREALIMR